jgi:hypothetical protein
LLLMMLLRLWCGLLLPPPATMLSHTSDRRQRRTRTTTTIYPDFLRRTALYGHRGHYLVYDCLAHWRDIQVVSLQRLYRC